VIIQFEISKPFRPILHVERFGFMTRWIWGFFSFAIYPRLGLHDIQAAFVNDYIKRQDSAKTKSLIEE
jgi:hypothetical protein